MSDIVARLRDWRSLHLTRLGGLFDEAADTVESLRREVREQRLEIAGLREERRALLDADRPQPDRPEAIETGESDRPKPIATPNPLSTPAECTVRLGCDMDAQRLGTPPFWDCPDCGWELDWNEEALTWCDECGAEWRYDEDEPPQSENEVR